MQPWKFKENDIVVYTVMGQIGRVNVLGYLYNDTTWISPPNNGALLPEEFTAAYEIELPVNTGVYKHICENQLRLFDSSTFSLKSEKPEINGKCGWGEENND